ncbi:PKD domain-containing protein [Hugenholtzia roseola]|uniref:PKD domain-containing protein n=1 Tax=Hugenholtzia roseola TaxID=1002 RepID=UPI00041C03B2|nr:PKD domain-containing protein [Hugenholtzia roseola]
MFASISSFFSNKLWLVLLLSVSLLTACKDGGSDDDIAPSPERPRVLISNPSSDTTVLVNTEMTFRANGSGGEATSHEWKVGSQTLAGEKEGNLYTLTHTFSTVGEFKVSITLTNEVGAVTVERTIKVEEPFVPVTTRLTNGEQKTWKFMSIKLNNTQEIIEDNEKRHTLVLYAQTQDTGNLAYNAERLLNNQAQSFVRGRWSLHSQESRIEIKDIFDRIMQIEELTPTKMVLKDQVTPQTAIWYYFDAAQ